MFALREDRGGPGVPPGASLLPGRSSDISPGQE